MGFGTPPGISGPIMTVYSHVIDGSFSTDDSLIGGAKTIDGVVLLAYVTDQDIVNDEYRDMYLYLNNIKILCMMDRDDNYVGIGSAYDGGLDNIGWVREFFAGSGRMPHTSYDIKAEETGVYKKTVKVVVIHRT